MLERLVGIVQNMKKYVDTEEKYYNLVLKTIKDNIVPTIYVVSTVLLFLVAYKRIKTHLKTLKRAFKIAVLNKEPSRSEHWILFDHKYQTEPIAILLCFATFHAIVDAYYFVAALFRAEYMKALKMVGQFTLENFILITIATLSIIVCMHMRNIVNNLPHLKIPVKTISLYVIQYYIAYVLSMSILYFFTTSKARFFAVLWLFFFTLNDEVLYNLTTRTNNYFGANN